MNKDIITPKNYKELELIIEKEIKENGNECDLNHIDITNINDLSYIFFNNNFNGDISRWDVSKVEYMYSMFGESFDRYEDLNNWKPFNLKDNSLILDGFSENNIFNMISKNKKVYWSSENFNLSSKNIKECIEKYCAEKEKKLLIEQTNNIVKNNNNIKIFKL